MEVIGCNNHLKDTKTPTADLCTCHLPRDMNFGMSPSARGKGETDIGLLVACKVQLSTEVIKWKTENLRLMKELDSAMHHTNDLKATVSKLVDRTKELEERLTQAEDENHHLKHRNATMDEEKAAIVQRISMGFDKYHSLPHSESKSLRLSREEWKLQKSVDQPVEDYIQVSHCLLDKMKQEIQEFREMTCQYCVKDEGDHSYDKDPVSSKVDKCEDPCDKELEETVVGLLSETKFIKQYLFDQRKELQSLMNFISPDEHLEINPSDNHEMQRSTHILKNSTSRSSENSECTISTKYPATPPTLSKMSLRREVGPNTTLEAGSQLPSGLSEPQQNPSQATTMQCQERVTEVTNHPDHRICPICEESFNDKTQKEFEEHVVNHLERESASLLDQYVVI